MLNLTSGELLKPAARIILLLLFAARLTAGRMRRARRGASGSTQIPDAAALSHSALQAAVGLLAFL